VVTLGVGVTVRVTDGVAVTLGVEVTVGVTEMVAVGVTEMVGVGVTEIVGVTVTPVVEEAVTLGVADTEAEAAVTVTGAENSEVFPVGPVAVSVTLAPMTQVPASGTVIAKLEGRVAPVTTRALPRKI